MSFKGFHRYPLVGKLATWYNQASSTFTQIGNTYNLYIPKSGGGDSITGRYDTAPATPYTVIAHTMLNPTDQTGLMLAGGLGFTDGTATFFLNTRAQSNSQTSSWSTLFCATPTIASVNTAGYQFGPGFPWTTSGWMMIRNDGTNIYFYIGDESGQNFYQIYTEAKASHLANVTLGIGIFSDNASSAKIDLMIDSWQVLGV